jgi:hypothetical protein
MLLAVASVEPGLDWDEAEHKDHADNEVEVGEISGDDPGEVCQLNMRHYRIGF